ncbi:hypothetical protein R3P38DRAFT_3099082 [Favolaschia claudopus]|uniref:Uncharacterized protein n=1 Tax=Favolaschia claudopus TaxID=2862362 RepID=A0AAV9ZMZ7_9AGAR
MNHTRSEVPRTQVDGPDLLLRHLAGNAPTMNDWESFVVHEDTQRLYSYGGIRPYDKTFAPTSDLHCLDLNTLRTLLRFRSSHQSPVSRELPALTETAVAIMNLDDRPHMFLFGGFDAAKQTPTSTLIAIELDALVWYHVCFPGPSVLPRLSATMVAVKNQLIIFGGRTEYRDDSPTLSTFSIAAFDSCAGWTWTCLDRTFPPNLPRLGYGMQATLIDNSACVLLTGGWVDNTEAVLAKLSTSHSTSQTLTWHSMPSVVILATWVPYAGGNGHLVPEIWLYMPAPIAQIRCADLRGRLWHLELDMQSFIVAGSRAFLLGSRDGHDDDAEAMGHCQLFGLDGIILSMQVPSAVASVLPKSQILLLCFIINCQRCNEWYHLDCARLAEVLRDLIDKFYCSICRHDSPNLQTTFKSRCRRGLEHLDPSSREACHKPARGLLSKYCSDRCGFDNVKQRLHTFAASGGNTDLFWDNVKHAQKPEAVVLSHDPLGSVTLRAQSANKLEPLRAALAEVQRHRSAIARNDALFLRKCLLKLCWDDEFVADRGSAIIEGYDGECTEQWWCTESPQCVRHQGWQIIRANDFEKESAKMDQAILRLATLERQIRNQIEIDG